MTNGNALSLLAVGWLVALGFLLAGPAERMLDQSCAKYAPTDRACLRL